MARQFEGQTKEFSNCDLCRSPGWSESVRTEIPTSSPTADRPTAAMQGPPLNPIQSPEFNHFLKSVWLTVTLSWLQVPDYLREAEQLEASDPVHEAERRWAVRVPGLHQPAPHPVHPPQRGRWVQIHLPSQVISTLHYCAVSKRTHKQETSCFDNLGFSSMPASNQIQWWRAFIGSALCILPRRSCQNDYIIEKTLIEDSGSSLQDQQHS